MPAPAPPLAMPESTDESPHESWSRPDDRFIPIRACDLAHQLAVDAAKFGLEPAAVREFAAALEEVIDRETGTFERRLADAYARFNPDRDTQSAADLEPATPDEYELLCTQLAYLLDKANYEELSDVEIAQAVLRAGTRNLSVRVDPNRIEFLRLWVRGRGETTKRERCRWRPWRHQDIKVPVFKRLMVVARLKDESYVRLKLFKEIPEAEVEALLPHAEVMMSLWDRIKLLSTGAGTVGITVSKLLKIAIGFAALWKLAWILLIGIATLGVRSALGYRNARMNRDWQRTRHLYFQNMGNNASALQLLVATVKQEEFKEVLLGYVISHRAKSEAAEEADDLPQPTPSTLCEQVEQYLCERFDVEVDFDIADAEDKLTRLGLRSADESSDILSIDQAIRLLRGRGDASATAARMLEC